MGMVINFPTSQRQSVRMETLEPRQPGQVVILPVIRVERAELAATENGAPRAPGRKRRRRASRS